MSPLGWILVVAGMGMHAVARQRDNALLDEAPEEVVQRHEGASRAQLGGIGLALALFFLLGNGPVALTVALGVMATGALGAALWRAQLPGPEGLRWWLGVEVLTSWGTYLGVALVLWG